MKLTFLLFLNLLFFQFSQAQTQNFLIENNQLIWQKVNDAESTKEELIEKIKNIGNLDNINITEDKLTANITDLSIDYKGYGSSEMSTPMYLSRSFVKAFFIVEFKDKKYRVTIKNIIFVQKYDDALTKANEKTEIEMYALSKKNTEFKNSFLKKPSEILNYTFSKLIEFKSDTENNKW